MSSAELGAPSSTRAASHLLVLCAGLLAYVNSLGAPFHFDDAGVILHDSAVHSWAAFSQGASGGLRPLLKLSYTANWALGADPRVFHAFNLLVHLLNVGLVMRLAAAAEDRSVRWPFRSATPAVLTTGLLFALHPLHTEAVTYISGRSSSLVTTFMLLACLAYVHGARSASSWRAQLLSLVMFVCAVLTKEASVALPGALLLWELCIERGSPRDVLRRQAPLWGVMLLASVALLMHPAYFTLLYELTGTRPLAQSVMHQLVGVSYLASRLLLVDRLCIDPGLGQHALAVREVLAPGLLVAALCCVATWQWRARPLLTFGVLWFLLHTLFPYVLLPRLDVINERHAYLANVGLFIAVGSLAHELWRRSSPAKARLAMGLGTLVLGVLFTATVARNTDYRSEVTLWESTVRVAPDNPRAQLNLGVAYERVGRLREAKQRYRAALTLLPSYTRAEEELGRLERVVPSRLRLLPFAPIVREPP